MFDRLKKAFGKEAKAEPPPSQLTAGPVSEWAATQGFGFSVDGAGETIALEGKVAGRPWRIQCSLTRAASARMYAGSSWK